MKLDAWTQEVALLTREHREARAADLAAKGKALRKAWATYASETAEETRTRAGFHAVSPNAWQLGTQGFPTLAGVPLPSTAQNKGAWHMARARGHRERFQRVGDCQQLQTIKVSCRNCTHVSERGVRCRTALACVSCRGKIANEKRCRLAANRRVGVDLIAKRGLFRHNARGGRWSEKLLTLTLPPTPGLDTVSRILLLKKAWTPFARLWNRWLKRATKGHVDRQGNSLARWYRNVEWTRGHGEECAVTRAHRVRRELVRQCARAGVPAPAEGPEPRCNCAGSPGGHPHAHMWFVGPFVPGASAKDDPAQNTIRNFWRRALLIAAKDFPSLKGQDFGDLVVDVRACRPGKGSLEEVIKYLFKDLDGSHGRIPPEEWAMVYEGYDGQRTTQGSRGLMSLELRERVLAGYLVNERTGEVREVELSDVGELPSSVVGHACPKCGRRGQWMISRRPMTDVERHALDARRPLAGAKRRQVPFFGEVAIA